MNIRLSAREGDLLAHLSAAVRQQVPRDWTARDTLDAEQIRTLGRLARKGLVELGPEAGFRITSLGVERARSVY